MLSLVSLANLCRMNNTAHNVHIEKAAEIAGGVAKLASKIGVTASAVSQWISGHRRVPAERCPQIERATSGAVRCEDLRPDVPWHVLRERRGEEAA